MISCRCIVDGRVQGVGFRYFVRRVAVELGVRGWTRNLADGTVEIRAEGEGESLRRFLDRVRQGPSHSRVDRLHLEETPVRGYDGFTIES